jgi:prepilin signal peptidase PulO-like enzyme (type II secretory pathway)
MMIYPVAAFLLGTCLGSFLNVVILRWIEAFKIADGGKMQNFSIGGRSHCPACRQELRWWELVPILSFVFLRGRCQRCGQSIAVQYPVVELALGLVVMVLAIPLPVTLDDSLSVILTIVIAALLVILFVIDLKTMLLPDGFIIALLIAVIGVRLVDYFYYSPLTLISALIGAAIGGGFLLLLWIITRGRGIGLGDVKLMVPLGLLFGPLGTLTLLFLAYLVGGLLAIYLLARGRAHLKTALPFGPFLCGAALLVLLFPSLPERLIVLLIGYNPWM